MELKERKSSSEGSPSSGYSSMMKEDRRSATILLKQDSVIDINQNAALETETTNTSRNSDLENPSRWGWVVVAAACLLMTPVAGFLGSFGNFIGPLTEDFGASKFVTSCIGSLPFGFALGLVPISTILIKKYGIRPICLVGAFAWLVGLISSSYASSIYWLFLTYSILIGIGSNFCFNSTMLLVGQYFPNKHQAIATCLATSGVSLGSLIVNPLIGMAIKSLGWRATWRVYTAIVVAIQLLCFAVYRNPPASDTNEQASEENQEQDVEKMEMIESNQNVTTTKIAKANTSELLRNPGIILWLIGTLCWSFSFTFPLIVLVDFMKTSFEVEAATANLVLIVYGVSELAGRVIGGFCGEKVKFSFTYIYAGFTIVAGSFSCITPFIHSIAWMYAYGLAVGITSGVANSIMFATSMQLFDNQCGKNIWGYTNVMVAIGGVTGPMGAGQIFDVTKSYTIAFEIGGGLLF